MWSILTIIVLQQFSNQTDINMLNLKMNWQGYGKAFLLPKSMRLLSQKLKNQVGLMTTNQLIEPGENFSITIRFNMDCLNENSQQQGFSLILNKYPLQIVDKNYTYKYFNSLLGQEPHPNGFVLIYYKEFLYFQQYQMKDLKIELLEKYGKKCKVTTDSEKNISFHLQKAGKLISISSVNEKLEKELCGQINNIDFDDFYLQLSGSDSDGNCGLNVKDLILKTQKDLNIIEQSEKEIGDGNYTYFTQKEQDNQTLNKTTDEQQKVYQKFSQFSKILSKKLMSFADYSQKELKQNFKFSIQEFTEKLDDSLNVIKLEAQVLQSMGDYVTNFKQNENQNLDDVLKRIFDWFDKANSSYENLDSLLNDFEKMLNEVDLEKFQNDIQQNAIEINDFMKKILKKTKKIKKIQNKNDFTLEEDIESLSMQLAQENKKQKFSFEIKKTFLSLIVLQCLDLLVFIQKQKD